MKLILHFGIHRTGSTSIQNTLAVNQECLGGRGFLYPNIEGRASHQRLPWRLKSNNILPKDVVSEINAQITTDTHTIILSSEDFCLLKSPRFFHELGKYYELNAVVYLRRQDLWLESWYNQHIRWPWDNKFSGSDIEFFLSNIGNFFWIDYQKLLKNIEGIVSIDRLYVNVVDEAGVKNTAVDFMKYCGIDPIWLKSVGNKNQSLSSAKIDILRRIDINELESAARFKIISALRKMDIKEDNGKTKFFTDRQRVKLIKRYSKSNAYVARKYFARDKLFSDHEPDNENPAFVSDKTAYQKYIPQLLKKIAEEN